MAATAYAIEVTGDREVVAAFRKLARESGDLSTLFGRIAADAATEARALSPVASGQLRGSIRPSGYGLAASVMAGGSAVPYAGVVEYGWGARRIAAEPFLRPAVDDKADTSAEQIAREVQRVIDRNGLG